MSNTNPLDEFLSSIKDMMRDALKAMEPGADPRFVAEVQAMLKKFINN